MKKKNKYDYLRCISYDTLWNNRGKVIQVYPETSELFKDNGRRGCSNCRKKRIARGILSKLMELPEGRDTTPLKGVFPPGLLELL